MEETGREWGGAYKKAKLCAWKSIHNYLEINKRRSDNECVKSQSQADWSVAELEAPVNTLLPAPSRRLALEKFQVAFCKNKIEKKCRCRSGANAGLVCMH